MFTAIELNIFWLCFCYVEKRTIDMRETYNNCETNVYWTVHHCNSWGMKDQLDVTCYFFFTYYALNMFRTLVYPSSGACDCVDELPHRSSCSQFVACWKFGCKTNTTKYQPQPNLQHTTNWEQDNGCGNSSTQSQAPEDGYTNVRNMLSA